MLTTTRNKAHAKNKNRTYRTYAKTFGLPENIVDKKAKPRYKSTDIQPVYKLIRRFIKRVTTSSNMRLSTLNLINIRGTFKACNNPLKNNKNKMSFIDEKTNLL